MNDESPRPMGKASKEDITPDLERYRLLALKSGASDARIMEAKSIKVDERVRLKCTIPRCPRAGETPNCPPYAPDLDLIRRAFSLYSKAIMVKCEVTLNNYTPGQGASPEENQQALLFHKTSIDVVAELERQAFRDGYHLAMGLGGGSCKDYLCLGSPCQFMENKSCRFPLQSRPSIEAMGIDVTKLINEAGWESYAITNEDGKIRAITVGLVFIV